MKNKFTALLLILAATVTFSACDSNDGGHINDVDLSPDPAETRQTEETAITTAADTVYVSRPMTYYSEYAVPADTEITYEFTREDEELHGILRELDPAWELFGKLIYDSNAYVDGEGIWVHFEQGVWDSDWLYQPLSRELPFDGIDGLKAELNKYFIDFEVSTYMYRLNPVQGMTTSQDNGVRQVYISKYDFYNDCSENGALNGIPLILELDGQLYRIADTGGEQYMSGIDIERTRVVSRDEYVIQFAYIFAVSKDSMATAKMYLRRDGDGSWKYADYLFDYPIDLVLLDFGQVWLGEPLDKMYLEGKYDPAELVDFDYSQLLEVTKGFYAGAGDFLGEEYGQFRDLYQRAYALTTCFEGRSAFPSANGGYHSAIIRLPLNDYRHNYLQYNLTGFSADSFYETLREIFTEEKAEEIYGGFMGDNHSILIYDGAMWSFFNDGFGSDVSRVYDEYAFELTEDTFDIIRTSYHSTADMDWDTEFHPELMDEYETQEHHCIFVNTENGWRCSRVDIVV